MRTIDALPAANQAPLVDEDKRQRLFGQTLLVAGALVNLVVLVALVAILSGAVTRTLLPIAVLGISVGCGAAALGNRIRTHAGR